MKAKFYIAFFSAILLTGNFIQAQRYEHRDQGNKSTTIIVNNYIPDHDFYYSSRINRFHRSYSSFGYYAPVFTETYWYGYQPYSWGLSIYGGGGFGFGMGIRYNYPVFGYGYGYDPFYTSSYYMGYDPVFYFPWYLPVVYNTGYRHMRSSYYYGWRGYNYNRWDYNYRPVYNNYNYYNYNYYNRKPSQDYSSVSRPPAGSNIPAPRNNPRIDYSRRGVDYSSSSGPGSNPGNNVRNRSNNGLHAGETSRNTNPASARDQGNSRNTPAGDNMHQGADNSRRSSERMRNSGNNYNNNSGTVNRGQTQGDVKAGSSRTPSSTRRGTGMSQGGSTNKSDQENAKSGSSSTSSSTGGKVNRRR